VTNNPLFQIDDQVQSKSNPSRIGTVRAISTLHAGIQFYTVDWHDQTGLKEVPEIDLRTYQIIIRTEDNLIQGRLANYQDFQRLITYHRLLRNKPLKNNIYAFNASRTRFYPYQFKPLVKFLDSTESRILICDEVGLGKTIEAGLILTELRARHQVKKVLIVCPANLCQKWCMEMKQRFAEEFRIFKMTDFLTFLMEYEEDPERTNLNAIISLEGIRSDKVYDRLEELKPDLDLVIIDEAHHLRNFGTKQRSAGKLLSSLADAMIMLTATPVHLGNENLFSLLNILDEDSYADKETTALMFEQNENIVLAQSCVSKIPPLLKEASDHINNAGTLSWFIDNEYLIRTRKQLETMLRQQQSGHEVTRAEIFELQKDISQCNLLDHIFTRTRKRDVQTNTAERHAFAVMLEFTELEQQFYNAVTEYVRLQSQLKTNSPLIQQWLINLPQRRMASSIPAMIEYYQQQLGDIIDEEEDYAEELIDLSDKEADPDAEYLVAKAKLGQIIGQWNKTGQDTKYNKLNNILQQSQKEHPHSKCMIFAFYKGTLRYLMRRLTADGFKVVLISGDVPAIERQDIVQRFKEDPSINIMLSSRVGSEGLDFQFCDTIFNYDLPWNPMEVEQRIGRLDRIGQKASVINIYNLWIKGTIEERILMRLYDRLEIFERSIGDLEMIIGDVIHELEKDIFNRNLTAQEEEIRAEQAISILEQRRKSLEQLEQDASRFIGVEEYFNEEVKAIKEKRRYVTGEQMRIFLIDFIKGVIPQTRLEYSHITNRGKIYPCNELKNIIINHVKSSELKRFTGAGIDGLAITFDSTTAFENPEIEFINVLHPLVTVITGIYHNTNRVETNAHHVCLPTERLAKGFYYYFIYRLTMNGLKDNNSLELFILDQSMQEVCNREAAEYVMGDMLEFGLNNLGPKIEVPASEAKNACEKVLSLIAEFSIRARADLESRNNIQVDRQLTSLNQTYNKKINRQETLLEKGKENNRQEKYLRMLQGTLTRLKSELALKQNGIEAQRTITQEHNMIASGILEII